MSAAMVTETAALRGTVPAETAVVDIAAIGISGVEVSAISISAVGKAAIGETMIDVPAIGIPAAVGVPASVVFALKPSTIKSTAVEISGISSFKKWPIVGIVSVIPIVTVPNRVVVVRVSGKLSFEGYTITVGISIIGVGVSALICRIGLLVDGRYLGVAPGGDQHGGGCQGGECKDLFHFVCDFKLAAELLFRFAHPGYKKANGAVDLTRVC